MLFRSLRKLSVDVRNLTEHCSWHLQISLCIERQPLVFVEPEYERLFREFHEAWSLKTGNGVKLPVLSNIERKISHKIVPSKELLKENTVVSDDSIDVVPSGGEDELESLLSIEFNPRTLFKRKKKTEEEVKELVNQSVDDDLCNINRLPESWLFLIVKYKDSSWSLPTTDLYFGDSIRDTLIRLCSEQIGSKYRPYFLGYCPFTFNKIMHENPCEIIGKKVFYYRARHLTNSLIDINKSDIAEHAWCTVDELAQRLDNIKYKKVFSTLPLFI